MKCKSWAFPFQKISVSFASLSKYTLHYNATYLLLESILCNTLFFHAKMKARNCISFLSNFSPLPQPSPSAACLSLTVSLCLALFPCRLHFVPALHYDKNFVTSLRTKVYFLPSFTGNIISQSDSRNYSIRQRHEDTNINIQTARCILCSHILPNFPFIKFQNGLIFYV
jgi:hypothetical protein